MKPNSNSTTISATNANEHSLRLLRANEVLKRIGVSRSSLYNFVKIGAFPNSVALGPRSVAWLESEIDDWISKKAATRPAPKKQVCEDLSKQGALK